MREKGCVNEKYIELCGKGLSRYTYFNETYQTQTSNINGQRKNIFFHQR